jgi:hypothetical protein
MLEVVADAPIGEERRQRVPLRDATFVTLVRSVGSATDGSRGRVHASAMPGVVRESSNGHGRCFVRRMVETDNPRAPRQVTVQPQEKAPDAGQPHVPHTRVKQPGQAPPDDDAELETLERRPDDARTTRNETASSEH